MYTIGMRVSPYTKELDLVVMGNGYDEFNEYHLEFAQSKLGKRRTVTVIPDDGKEISTLSDRLEEHKEYWRADFEFPVDGDLSGEAVIQICWADHEIEVTVIKAD